MGICFSLLGVKAMDLKTLCIFRGVLLGVDTKILNINALDKGERKYDLFFCFFLTIYIHYIIYVFSSIQKNLLLRHSDENCTIEYGKQT
jgi:hypothetical protein